MKTGSWLAVSMPVSSDKFQSFDFRVLSDLKDFFFEVKKAREPLLGLRIIRSNITSFEVHLLVLSIGKFRKSIFFLKKPISAREPYRKTSMVTIMNKERTILEAVDMNQPSILLIASCAERINLRRAEPSPVADEINHRLDLLDYPQTTLSRNEIIDKDHDSLTDLYSDW